MSALAGTMHSYCRFSLTLLLISSPLLANGCKREEGESFERESLAQQVGQVLCEAFSSCACGSIAIGNAAECAQALQPSLERAIVEGEIYGLRYFPQCLTRAEAYLEALGCGVAIDEDDPNLQQAQFNVGICKLLAGDAGRGEPCTNVGSLGFSLLGDTCRHNLVCSGGICVDWPDRQGDICHEIGVCPPALACIDPDFDGVKTCEPPSGKSGPCNPHDYGAGCTADLYCSPLSSSCESLPSAGQPCLNNTCASGSQCIDLICTVPPGVGQECLQGSYCAEGLVCDDTTTTCIGLPAEGQECYFGYGCAAGLVCDFNVCVKPPAAVCAVPEVVGLCVYQDDGICDEPEGTGLCREGTDPSDCFCSSMLDGVCDEPEGTGYCNEGTDAFDCEDFCPTQFNGICDEPQPVGNGTCAAGKDPADCGATCDTIDNGVCDEPQGTNTCPAGTDTSDCGGNPTCPTAGDGVCDEPISGGTGTCPFGSDPIDCGNTGECQFTNDGVCDEPNFCPPGTDTNDCFCGFENNLVCDPNVTGNCPSGSDLDDCQCPWAGDDFCDEPSLCEVGTDILDCN